MIRRKAQANHLPSNLKHILMFNVAQKQLDDTWERMASKILNVFSDPVFFNVTELRDWNLPEIIRHLTLMALMFFSCIAMTRISDRRLSTRYIGGGSIMVWGAFSCNYGSASCAGALKRSWMQWHVRTLFAEGTRLCRENWILLTR